MEVNNKIFLFSLLSRPDYGVAALSTILDMVKVIQFGVSEGKVAVHCHAGLGKFQFLWMQSCKWCVVYV